MIALGIIEPCVGSQAGRAREVLLTALELCSQGERLGFSRFWITEHHDANFATASPELLLPLLAASTEEISIGIGGQLLRLYSPLQLANQMQHLESLFPGRVITGLGRGLPPACHRPLYKELALDGPSSYQEKVVELLAYLHGEGSIRPLPSTESRPKVWLCGSRQQSFWLAESLSLPYSHALFLQQGTLGLSSVAVQGLTGQGHISKRLVPFDLALAGSCSENFKGKCGSSREFGLDLQIHVAGGYVACKQQLRDIIKTFRPDSISLLDLSPEYCMKVDSYEAFANICTELSADL